MLQIEYSRLSRRRVARGVSLVLVSTVVFGSIPSLLVSLQGDLDFLTLLALRGSVAASALGLLAFASAARSRRRSGRRWVDRLPAHQERRWDRRAFAMGFLLYGPTMVLYYSSLRYLDTSVSVALAFMYPTMVVLILSAARRRRPPARDLILGLMALAGVAILSLPGSSGGVTSLGVLMVVTSSVGYAFYVILASRISSEMPPLRVAAEMTLGGALSSLVIVFAASSFSLPKDAESWLVVFAQGLVLVAGMAAYFAGLAILGATRSSLIDSAQPLVAAVTGAVLLGERLLAVQALGIFLILVSVVGAVLSARRQELTN